METLKIQEAGKAKEKSEGQSEKTTICQTNNAEGGLGASPECTTISVCPPNLQGGLKSNNGGKKECDSCKIKDNNGGNLGGGNKGNNGGNLGGGSKGGDKGGNLGSGDDCKTCEFPDPDGYDENTNTVSKDILEKQVRADLTDKYNKGLLVTDKGTTIGKDALEVMIKDELTKRLKNQGKQTGVAI